MKKIIAFLMFNLLIIKTKGQSFYDSLYLCGTGENTIQMNRFDSTILKSIFNYFTENPKDLELKQLLSSMNITYPMKLSLINYVIESYPRKEMIILDCLEFASAHPQSHRQMEIRNYPIMLIVHNNILFNQQLGEYLVHTSYLDKYYRAEKISKAKKEKFILLINQYLRTNTCETISFKGINTIEKINSLADYDDLFNTISK